MALHAAPAKVNLRLTVLAREASGYHQIETLFCALEVADTIEIEPGPAGIALEVEGADLGEARDNLVHIAARAFCAAIGETPALRIVLHKNVPAGAGLGGGSSDAAATLRALNAMHGYPLDDARLVRLGGTLGSDVPFFLSGAALALAWGRGDRLLPLPALPRRPVLVVAPREPIATAAAYGWLAEARARRPSPPPAQVLPPAAFADWDLLAGAAANDFEEPVFARRPDLARIRDALRDAGARPALLAGSGSAVFGVFASERVPDGVPEAVTAAAPDARIIATHTASAALLGSAPRR